MAGGIITHAHRQAFNALRYGDREFHGPPVQAEFMLYWGNGRAWERRYAAQANRTLEQRLKRIGGYQWGEI